MKRAPAKCMVLSFGEHQNHPEGLLQYTQRGPTPRVSDSVGLAGWGEGVETHRFVFLTNPGNVDTAGPGAPLRNTDLRGTATTFLFSLASPKCPHCTGLEKKARASAASALPVFLGVCVSDRLQTPLCPAQRVPG